MLWSALFFHGPPLPSYLSYVTALSEDITHYSCNEQPRAATTDQGNFTR